MIEASLSNASARLRIWGELDWGVGMSLRRLADDLTFPGLELTIDLSDASHVSPAASIALAGVKARVEALGGSMVLANVPARFRGDLELVGLGPEPGFTRLSKHERVP